MHWMRHYYFALAIIVSSALSANGEPTRCTGHTGIVVAVALSPDGKYAVSCDKLVVRIWETSDGSPIRTLQGFVSESADPFINDAAFSPDGRSLAIAASQQSISFWDTKSWASLDWSLPVEQTACHLAYSPDGAKLAVAENTAVKVWSLPSRKLAREFRFNGVQIGRAWRVAYSSDGLVLAAALHDYGASFEPKEPKVRAWNTLTGDIVFTDWNLNSATAVAISPDASLLAAASGNAIEIWSLRTHDSVLRVTDSATILCIAFSPDGKTIATSGNDPAIKLWDAATGTRVGLLRGHTGQVHDLCYSTDGKTLVSAGSDKDVLIWNLEADATKE